MNCALKLNVRMNYLMVVGKIIKAIHMTSMLTIALKPFV